MKLIEMYTDGACSGNPGPAAIGIHIIYEDGRIERADNVKDPKLYIEQIDEMIERKKKLFCIEI